MCAQRWQDPKEHHRLEDALERLLEEMANREEAEADEVRVAVRAEGIVPAVDLNRTRDHYQILVEVPGVDPAGLRVTAGPRAVVVEGAWSQETEAGELLLQEMRRGAFRRVIELPASADGRDARAILENGILEITLPMSDNDEEEEIPVELT